MNDSQVKLLEGYLQSFHVPDIKYFVTVLSSRFLINKISKASRKGVMVSMIVEEVVRFAARNHGEILDVLVAAMNERRSMSMYERVGDSIALRSRPSNSPNVAISNSNLTSATAAGTTLHRPRPTTTPTTQIHVEYKPSPFYTRQARLETAKLLPSNPNTRSNKHFGFELTPAQLQLFEERYPEDGRPMYEIRFFCSDFNIQTADLSPSKDVEFPPICEVKVNSDHTISGTTLRGMKNKPGTTNPPDITYACHLTPRRNIVEFVYANTMKTYIGSLELVKRVPIPDIVKNMKETNIISKEKTLQRLQAPEDDNDIVLESETISTKCPLGFTRIRTPSRSIHCHHLQCFDATNFLLMNQQTPTWCCPVCNRKMGSCDEVGVDEFFQDILAQVPENVEGIRIEEGGRFKILDEENDSATDDDGHGDTQGGNNNQRQLKRERSTDNDLNTQAADSVTILDDDTEDEEQQDPDDIPLAKRIRLTLPTSANSVSSSASPPHSSSMHLPRQQRSGHATDCIDLTLDSDDDEADYQDDANQVDTTRYDVERDNADRDDPTQDDPTQDDVTRDDTDRDDPTQDDSDRNDATRDDSDRNDATRDDPDRNDADRSDPDRNDAGNGDNYDYNYEINNDYNNGNNYNYTYGSSSNNNNSSIGSIGSSISSNISSSSVSLNSINSINSSSATATENHMDIDYRGDRPNNVHISSYPSTSLRSPSATSTATASSSSPSSSTAASLYGSTSPFLIRGGLWTGSADLYQNPTSHANTASPPRDIVQLPWSTNKEDTQQSPPLTNSVQSTSQQPDNSNTPHRNTTDSTSSIVSLPPLPPSTPSPLPVMKSFLHN
ncbi:hypothetical protein [Absidia glauca]|uniref:SP-RING-type domain-containing protein n=1 Tax=Absidia glauca TaxID=4829 RepID=A0A168M835_ABSGL|nr:hypothetical protein [Absidia glauca]